MPLIMTLGNGQYVAAVNGTTLGPLPKRPLEHGSQPPNCLVSWRCNASINVDYGKLSTQRHGDWAWLLPFRLGTMHR